MAVVQIFVAQSLLTQVGYMHLHNESYRVEDLSCRLDLCVDVWRSVNVVLCKEGRVEG